MIKRNKVIVVDVDGTLTLGKAESSVYSDAIVCSKMKSKLAELKLEGYWVIIATSRNMRTFEGNIGQIVKNTVPELINWLDKHEIQYDELHIGKPWCGEDGFYIDDRAVRPREFLENSLEEIKLILRRDKMDL
jgi:capsule biosynthesis phosphatase